MQNSTTNHVLEYIKNYYDVTLDTIFLRNILYSKNMCAAVYLFL